MAHSLTWRKRLAWLALAAALPPSLSGCGFEEQLPTLKLATGLPLDPALALSRAVVTAATADEIAKGKVVESSYIVTFRGDPGAAGLRFASFKAEYGHHWFGLAERYLIDPRVVDLNYITTVDLQDPKDPEHTAELAPPPPLQLAWDGAFGAPTTLGSDVTGVITEVNFTDDAAAQELLAEWERDGRIWFAEPNYTSELMDPPITTPVKDAYVAANVWWHSSIKLTTAFEKIAASTAQAQYSPVIAVLDSGVDVQNASLADAIWTNDTPGQSGCVGDTNGCDTTKATKGVLGTGAVFPYLANAFNTPCPPPRFQGDPEPGTCEHGTHVSGIIAAKLGSGASEVVGGVCPVCRVMAIKIIREVKGKGVAPDAAILNGLKYLSLFKRANGNVVRVANSSFGKYTRSRAVAVVVSVLRKAPNEVLLIGAAGNEDSMQRVYPAAFADAIAVSAVADNDGKAVYSNFGPWVDVAAPGGDKDTGTGRLILSTVPGGQGYKQGTSMATPVVAGVAGLILAVDPARGFDALRSSIVNRADPRLYLPEVNNGLNYSFYFPKLSGDNVRRPLLGAGVVDVAAALESGPATGILASNLQRVNNGCGSAGSALPARSGIPTALLVLIAPLAAALARNIRRSAYEVFIRRVRGSRS